MTNGIYNIPSLAEYEAYRARLAAELKERAFDYLAEMALQRMANMKEKKSELESQRRLLKRKLDAMQAGYGIELDLQLSSDGVAMVFHDDTLDRLTQDGN